MENSTASSTTTSDDGFGLFAAEFGITSLKSDLVRWNKDWETVLRTISSKDVYSVFSELMYKIGLGDPSTLSPMIQKFTDRVCRHQEQAIDAWAELEKDDRFSMPWMLLDEKEQRKHLLNGVRGACTSSAWRQDTRAMCPEIVVSSLQRGMAGHSLISRATASRASRTWAQVLLTTFRVNGGTRQWIHLSP
jgi:hypothetical protein